jgi:hypothetical protein
MTEEEQEEQETPTPAESGGDEEESGPDAAELDKDPAYNPDDENLKGLKGG